MTEFLSTQQSPRLGKNRPFFYALLIIAVVCLAFFLWQMAARVAAPPESPANPPVVYYPEVAARPAAEKPAPTPAPAAQPTPPPPDTAVPLVTPEPAARADAADAAQALLAEARADRLEKRLVQAREKAWQALEKASDDATRAGVEAFLGEVNVQLMVEPWPTPEKSPYTVTSGDSIDRIAKQFGSTKELLRRNNRITGDVIHPDQRLQVASGTWSIRVNKTRNDLELRLNDRFFKRYRVGTGEYSRTPTGTFTIVDRIAEPAWWKEGRGIPYGDPENLLGTHWLALDVKGYGIHGTWEPGTIGKQSSAGCVRLVNEDIEELYTLVTTGTTVVIED